METGSVVMPMSPAGASGGRDSPAPALARAAEIDRMGYSVACLNTQSLPFTMVSNAGFYCDVWRSAGRIVGAEAPVDVDFVVKISKRRCTAQEVRLLGRDYRRLRDALGEIVPEAMFVSTTVNRAPGAVVLAEACRPWFDLSHPTNQEEAAAMLRSNARLRAQLAHFVSCAKAWLEEGLLIDLQGSDNLVIDPSRGVQYLDSFYVFFYLSLLDVIPEVDEELLYRIEQSKGRLDYLEGLL